MAAMKGSTLEKFIPANIEALKGLATARQWEKAAHAWAFVGEGKQFTVSEFAAQKVNGLRAAHTITAYVNKWQEAIDSGHAKPVLPGQSFTLPDLPWEMVSDATRPNRVGDVDAYVVAAEEEGTTVGMAIRTGSSVPALKAAIKADPKVAEAAREALRESFDERRQAMIEAHQAKEKAKATITDPYIPSSEDTPPEPKTAAPLNLIRLLKIDRDLKYVQELLTGYEFEDATTQAATLKMLTQMEATISACKSLIQNGSVSAQAEDFLKSLS